LLEKVCDCELVCDIKVFDIYITATQPQLNLHRTNLTTIILNIKIHDAICNLEWYAHFITNLILLFDSCTYCKNI